jgi:hypothetical protein
MHMFSVGRGGAGNIRSPSQDVGKDHPQTVTILNEHAAVQAEYEQNIKKHHAESNPVVCPSGFMSCHIDITPHRSIPPDEAVLVIFLALAPVLVVLHLPFAPRDEAALGTFNMELPPALISWTKKRGGFMLKRCMCTAFAFAILT